MAEMVASAVLQEAVSGAFSYLSSDRDKNTSQRHNLERMEMVETKLDYALERTAELPMTYLSLHCRRKMFKRAYKECTEVVARHRLRVLEVDKEQRVTDSSSLPKRYVNKVRLYILSFLGMNKDEHLLNSSDVRRFERFADDADKFVRDVEGGCTLRHYNFFCPLIEPLLEGKFLFYNLLQGSHTLFLVILPIFLEEHGAMAFITLLKMDSRMVRESFCFFLSLRLSESTDIIRTILYCLELLGPPFISMAKDAVCQFAALQPLPPDCITKPDIDDSFIALCLCGRSDPVCCREKRHRPCAGNTMLSRLPYDIPEPIVAMCCRISAAEYTNYFPDSNDILSDWPTLDIGVYIFPHLVVDWVSGESPGAGAIAKMYDSLHEIPEMAELVPKAMDRFIHQPEQESYSLDLFATHGYVSIELEKPRVENVQSKANSRFRPRRVANRRRRR